MPRMLRSIVRLAALAVCLFALACNFTEKKADGAPALVAPSAAEAKTFADEFIGAVSASDVPRASAMVDWDVLLARATAGTSAPARFHAGFIKGAKGTAASSSYARQLSATVAQGAKISLLRVRGDEGGRSALIRILQPNGGVTYNELLLAKNDAGKVHAADVYTYATGEYMSDTLKRMYKFAVASQPTFMERLQKKKNPVVQNARLYQEMSTLVTSGQHQQAVALFKRMPPELRKEKSVLVAYVTAAGNLEDDNQYELAIDELRKAYPNDSGIDLMLIDGFILKERYDDTLAAIDRLDNDLGGDPYLDILRANVNTLKGDDSARDRFARRAVEREPALAELMQ
jgi:tetratricopeptide (TPR) repeat protein